MKRKGARRKTAEPKLPRHPLVAIAAPSLRLLEQLKGAKAVLDSFKIRSEIRIVAAHRAPRNTIRFANEVESRGFEVVIAAGEGSAHLPGMIASLTTIPVIGIPLQGSSLNGMDSLLSIVQMPRGVPVGTMAINSGYNAGVFACQILSLKYPNLKEKLRKHREVLEAQVESEDSQSHKR